ncbi:hypothetical protein J6590_028860 [Homalodisca vitripennis]|nr:hypothetical protein J6590_028860 [Homalodisca vitripennis]
MTSLPPPTWHVTVTQTFALRSPARLALYRIATRLQDQEVPFEVRPTAVQAVSHAPFYHLLRRLALCIRTFPLFFHAMTSLATPPLARIKKVTQKCRWLRNCRLLCKRPTDPSPLHRSGPVPPASTLLAQRKQRQRPSLLLYSTPRPDKERISAVTTDVV